MAKSSSTPKRGFKTVKAKTRNQELYLKSIEENLMTFGVGVAGGGKSYLAIYKALEAFKNGEVEKILLCRPAIEAGEKLGFLPGELDDKLDPYMIPLFDAIGEIVGYEESKKMIEKGLIQLASLAHMRGRTFKNAIVILDEAQNTTPVQMKMFLTRFGYDTRFIITGDLSQSDLNSNRNGLADVVNRLCLADHGDGMPDGVQICWFDLGDVCRHPLVGEIIQLYNKE